ncbi:ras GTPase-activating protein 1 isoform X2 [Magallana gigas]|uniref:Ras GTPase-activating protein 1 n=1 Tax=Magallana gigas TaxID=29159 RepID=A0A8W8HXU1_MAGGI|nr:ras GTPase-activating protein 1 isoform X2 [Crassostrea gigas]
MADNNSAVETAAPSVGQMTEDTGPTDAGDDDDPLSENQDHPEETMFITQTAPPENQWYHGRLGRQVAEDRLRTAGETGSYLVRESERNKGSYVLSYLGKNGLTHFKISAICGDYYIGGRRFDSMALLVGYYTSCSYLLKGEQLKFPVSPPEPVDDRRKVVAVLSFSKMPETDELSFEKGDVFIVLNEMGDGWLWVKSLRTNEDGQIHEALVDNLSDSVEPVQGLPYFHASITKEEAVEKLREAGQGSFLVRPSENSPGNYSLFVLCDKVVQRFRIEKQGKQLFLMGGRYFDSLDGIIERYKKEEIVEGHTLGAPVTREMKYVSEKLERLSHKGSADDLYDSIRQSSRGPMTGRQGNKLEMKGYLYIKKNSQNKKFKNMFFVLLGDDKQLCYLENDKRSRPKGLIDLSYSSLYPVHDSFFGRPNCFQLITNSFNHSQIYYLCAENIDLAQNWIQRLRPYCVNTAPVSQQRLSALKELRSLTVEVVDAQKLSTKLLPHPYCILNLKNPGQNPIKVCRTQVEEGHNPVWEEKFILDDIPSDIESISISVHNYSKRFIDKEIGKPIAQILIPLEEIKSLDLFAKWFSLVPVSPTSRGEMGSLRIRARYLHEIIMPEDKYSTLKELILNGDLSNLLELFSICGNDRIPLAKALLQIFRHEQQEKVILKTMNDLEIAREDIVSTLFRATSLATTLMDQYMKMTATQFVASALKDPIIHITESKQSCELNPTMLESGCDIVTNRDHFLHFLEEMTESIFKSTDSCPKVLRYICSCLQRSVSAKWPSDESVRTRVVSGFIFLRLLCPAILNPKSFNLITETPSDVACRTLKLIAKALQNLANLVEFGIKEAFMEVINPFIKKNKPRMIKFLDELSVDDNETSSENSLPVDSVARDLATMHTICATHQSELRKQAETKPSLKKLVAVTDILTDHKKRYMT